MNLNKVFLIGRLTQNPQIKTTSGGQTVCTFGLATNRFAKDPQSGEVKKMTEYHNIVLWRRLAEIASKYLSKGSLVLIEGRIQTRSWQGTNGNSYSKTEIVAEKIQLGPKTLSQKEPPEEKPTEEEEIPVIEEEINIKDIPF